MSFHVKTGKTAPSTPTHPFQILPVSVTPSDKKFNSESNAVSSNLHDETMSQWVNFANLMELKCMTLEVAELLIAAGISSLKQLGESIPENLHQRLGEENNRKKLLEHPPLFEQVMEMVILSRMLSS